MKNVRSAVAKNTLSLDRLKTSVEGICNDISELKSTPGRTTDNANGKGNSTSKPSMKYKKIMESRVQHLSDAFGVVNLSRSIFFCLVNNIVRNRIGMKLSAKRFESILSIMFFSIGRKEDKSANETGFGPVTAKFRRRVMITALRNAQDALRGSDLRMN